MDWAMNEKKEGDSKTRQYLRLLMSSQKRIYTYILMLVPNTADADDIMQDTVEVMWSKFDQFERGSNFAAWGVQVAYYNVMNYQRKSRTVKKFQHELFESVADKATEIASQEDSHLESLRHCVSKLREKDQKLINMKYENGMTTKQLSEILDRSLDGLYRTISRIHKLLAKCIKTSLAGE